MKEKEKESIVLITDTVLEQINILVEWNRANRDDKSHAADLRENANLIMSLWSFYNMWLKELK